MLLREIEDSFPEARIIRLEVEPANAAAVAFYTANGFAEVGNTANCGGANSGIPAINLEKALSLHDRRFSSPAINFKKAGIFLQGTQADIDRGGSNESHQPC